ncbi:MAG: hypothetical protein LUE23_08875 [Lachnospiraceae bacterium]|nr:hypothetical protein [Lachnospiraceae bacterium]
MYTKSMQRCSKRQVLRKQLLFVMESSCQKYLIRRVNRCGYRHCGR